MASNDGEMIPTYNTFGEQIGQRKAVITRGETEWINRRLLAATEDLVKAGDKGRDGLFALKNQVDRLAQTDSPSVVQMRDLDKWMQDHIFDGLAETRNNIAKRLIDGEYTPGESVRRWSGIRNSIVKDGLTYAGIFTATGLAANTGLEKQIDAAKTAVPAVAREAGTFAQRVAGVTEDHSSREAITKINELRNSGSLPPEVEKEIAPFMDSLVKIEKLENKVTGNNLLPVFTMALNLLMAAVPAAMARKREGEYESANAELQDLVLKGLRSAVEQQLAHGEGAAVS